jgi:hypothetical protein
MTKTRILHSRPLFYGCGLLAALALAAGGALAHPQPALTIPECARASLLRSTIDPKKPDAKQKAQQAAHLQQVCEAKMKQVAPRPAPPTRTAAPRPPLPPKAPPQPPPRSNRRSRSLFGGLVKYETTSSPEPAPRVDRSQQTYSGPAPSYGAAPRQTSYGPAAAPAAPPAAAAPATPPPAAAPASPPAPAAAVAPGATVPRFDPTTTTAPSSSPTNTAPLTPEQLNVFGVQLYQGLKLPACATGVIDTSDARAYDDTSPTSPAAVSATCAQTGAAAQPIAQRFADLDGVPVPQKLKFALVRLAPAHCPSWVGGSCTLAVATQGGIVVGLSFFTRPGQDRAVEQTITAKYGSAPSAREAARCEAPGRAGKHEGLDRTWKLDDLTVRYRPLSGLTCEQGRVLVDGTPLSKLRDQQVATSSAEPNM